MLKDWSYGWGAAKRCSCRCSKVHRAQVQILRRVQNESRLSPQSLPNMKSANAEFSYYVFKGVQVHDTQAVCCQHRTHEVDIEIEKDPNLQKKRIPSSKSYTRHCVFGCLIMFSPKVQIIAMSCPHLRSDFDKRIDKDINHNYEFIVKFPTTPPNTWSSILNTTKAIYYLRKLREILHLNVKIWYS